MNVASLAHRISTVQYGKYDTVVSKISKNGLYLIVSSPDSHRSWLSGLSDTIIPIDTLWACISKNIDSSWCNWTTFAGMGWVQRIGSWGFSDLVRSHTIKPLPNPKIAFNILNIHSSKIDKKQPIINHKRQIAKIIATKHFNSKVATNETQNTANWFV